MKALASAVMHNEILLKQGIDVDVFKVDGKPDPDPDTKKQFAEQREAALAKELAKSQVKKLEAETERERAEAARKTEHEKIEAQALMAKEKLDYERQKQNEVIAAQKKLELAQIAKQEAEVKAEQEAAVAKVEANKLREVAEIEKQTEAARLEKAKLIAQQKITEAEAKHVCIEKSGAITELQQAELEYGFKREAVKWENIGKGIAQTKLPQMWVAGGNGITGGAQNPIEMLVNTMTLEKLNNIAAKPAASK